VADWASLFAGQVSDPGPLIAQTAEMLDAFLLTRPQADQEVLEIIGKRLGTEIGERTLGDVRSALANYLGQDPASLVAWVTSADQANRIAQVEASAPPRVTALLRAILGLYGSELALAYTRWGELPDDWILINREIYHDLINERVLVKVRIDKNNGEQAVIQGPAYSILELAANMVRTCNMVGRPDAFTRRTIDMLSNEFEQFLKLVRGPSDKPARSSDAEAAGPSARR